MYKVQSDAKKVFEYFYEISSIPHGSSNTEKIAQYCLDFAKERGLKAQKDKGGNVIIWKNGTLGYENSEPVILQGHFDMVCEKTKDCVLDMTTQGINICSDGEYMWADNTTLGADDGIAVAYMLTLLDSLDIPHPPIEAVFTNDEEIGLLGARALDVSELKGKRLINIDSEKEGILTVGCAGGVRAFCEIGLDYVDTSENDNAVLIEINGLKGGHSGIDINLGRKNAHILLGRVLQHVARTIGFNIASIEGGKKTNVIPNNAKAVICTNKALVNDAIKSVEAFNKIIKNETHISEPNIEISAKICAVPNRHTDDESTRKIIFTLQQIPNGVQTMSPDIPNMVQTSLNMGELSIEDDKLKMGYLIRSNAGTGKQLIVQKLSAFVEYLYGKTVFTADYPAWEYSADSNMRDIMVSAYEEIYAEKPEISTIHAGLECGILAGKIADIDMVSFGPDLENVHTPNERMSISSAVRCWKYLLKVLEMCR